MQLHCYWPLTCKDPTHTETPQQNSADILQCVESVIPGPLGSCVGGLHHFATSMPSVSHPCVFEVKSSH